MKNLRVGVVGVGHIGSNHARLYAELSSAEFTAVYDVDPINEPDNCDQVPRDTRQVFRRIYCNGGRRFRRHADQHALSGCTVSSRERQTCTGRKTHY